MKIIDYYVFFLNDEKNQYEDYCEKGIYAYTDDKELAKKFKETRNRKFLQIRKLKNVSQEYIHAFAEQFPGGYLIRRDIKTAGSEGDCIKIPMVLTKIEYDVICNTEAFIIYNSINLWKTPLNPKIFAPRYYEAMKILRFPYMALVRDSDVLILDDTSMVQIDQLQIFLNTFGELFIGRKT